MLFINIETVTSGNGVAIPFVVRVGVEDRRVAYIEIIRVLYILSRVKPRNHFAHLNKPPTRHFHPDEYSF